MIKNYSNKPVRIVAYVKFPRKHRNWKERTNEIVASLEKYVADLNHDPIGAYVDFMEYPSPVLDWDSALGMLTEKAELGEIDIILTKSLYQISNSTTEAAVILRKFKECGVEVYCERENMDNMGPIMESLYDFIDEKIKEERNGTKSTE